MGNFHFALAGAAVLWSVQSFSAPVCGPNPIPQEINDALADMDQDVPLADEYYRGSCALKERSAAIKSSSTDLAVSLFSNEPCGTKRFKECLPSCADKAGEDVTGLERTIRRSYCKIMMRSPNERLDSDVLARIAKSAHQTYLNYAAYVPGGADHEKLMERVKTGIEAYKKAEFCPNGASSRILYSHEEDNGPFERTVLRSPSSQELEKNAAAAYESQKEEIAQAYVNKRMTRLEFCGEPRLNPGTFVDGGEFIFPKAVPVSVGELKADNEWILKGDSPAQLLKQIQDDPNIADNLKCGRVPKFEIYASSNLQANRGAAAQKFGAWGFDKLSAARANEFITKVVSKVVLKDSSGKVVFDGSNPETLKNQVNTTLGSRDTGASGPCPYTYFEKGGKLVIQPDPRFDPKSPKKDPELIAQLEEAKAVRVVLRFEGPNTCANVTPPATASKSKMYSKLAGPFHCFKIQFSCNP